MAAYLTPKAHALLLELRPLVDELGAQMLQGFSNSEQKQFRAMLERVRHNLGRQSAAADDSARGNLDQQEN